MYDVLLRTTLEGQIQGKKVCGTLVNCCAMNTQVTVVTCLDNCEPQRCGVSQYSVQFEMMPPPNQPLTRHISVTLCISAACAVVRCLTATFVYCVETATDAASFYRMRIGKRTQSFEWYHFH